MRNWLLLVFLGTVLQSVGQSEVASDSGVHRYFEDQFYVGFTYNFLGNTPEVVTQRNLSYGLQFGAIKDIPLNAKGTKAVGFGLGLALNTYYSNVIAIETANGISYTLGENTIGFNRSKLETHLLEFPLEFRWRSSTLEEYRFWRLYTGIKAGYVLGARSTSVIEGNKNGFYNTDVERFQYGLTLNVGYNTFNIHMYYALNDLFKEGVTLNNEVLGFSPLRIGVIFYIL
jgi:hypothetical protein